jgi:hypothetical protein
MTTDQDLDRLLDRWFEQRQVHAGGRVIDVVVGRVERQRQLPAWRVSWRDTPVNGSIKPLAAIAAVIVIAVAGVALVLRPSGPSVGAIASPAPSPSPSPTASLAPSSTPGWKPGTECGDAGPLDGCAGPLTPGTYTSTGLQPPVTYTLTTPWVNIGDWSPFFMLYPDTPENRALAAANDPVTVPYILVVPRPTIHTGGCTGRATDVEVNAAGFADYLASREGVSVTDPIPVTVNGLSGLQVDVEFEPAWNRCFLDMPSDAFAGKPDGIRYIVLDRPNGGSVMISLVALTDFDRFVAAAMPVVETFRFDLGAQPSPSAS